MRYERVEPLGGVFEPVPGRQASPAWSFGPNKDPMYQCPVSAIPSTIWPIFTLWSQCQGMKALPKAGGVLDQPMIVRKAFPVFADELERLENTRNASGSSATAANAAAVALAAVFGRRR